MNLVNSIALVKDRTLALNAKMDTSRMKIASVKVILIYSDKSTQQPILTNRAQRAQNYITSLLPLGAQSLQTEGGTSVAS